MKKNSFFKNTGRICLAVGIMTTIMLSSCLKDSSPGAVNFNTGQALVSWQYYGFSAQPIEALLGGSYGDSTGVEITLSVASIVLKTPVTVTVVEDPTDATAFVTANGGSVLPAADYSLANGGVITIEPGQQIVRLWVHFNLGAITFNSNNPPLIGLKITNATGATIPSNLNVAIVYLESAGG
jgi:hypothetical protein